MVKSSELSCNSFFSHPGIPLKEHLKDVGNACRLFAKTVCNKEDLTRTSELIGKCHDFGKYNPYFQQHFNRKVEGDLYKHSLISAIFASWVVKQEVKDDLLAALAFLCVNSHHTGLKSFHNEVRKLEQPLLRRQIEAIKTNCSIVCKELEEIGLPLAKEFIRNFENCAHEVKETLEKVKANITFKWDEQERWRIYFTTLLLFSSLIDADRRDAACVESKPAPSYLADVKQYRLNKFAHHSEPSQINRVREELFDEVDRRLTEILNSGTLPSILTLTAPTGCGKTLLGFHVALKLRERLSVEGLSPRIIYTLPYINIVEQTHTTIESVLSMFNKELPITLLLKHHHLYFPKVENKEEEETLDKVLLLVDSWDSQIIVTTFEQLIKSLISNSPNCLKKFHNLANSVILLDEIQAIPLEYWKLIKSVLLYLVKNLNVKIIFMTATMPAIFEKDTIELGSPRYYRMLKRIKLVSRVLKPQNVKQFVDYFFSNWDSSSALLVLNTIRTSKEVYRRIAEKLEARAARVGSQHENIELQDPTKIVLAYLSTSVIPKERKRRISLINKYLKENRKVILVSTQVVEAGVDLDFDIAFRDVGPLDAIIQVAGRCNRNWRRDRGKEYIVRILDADGKEDSKKIYGQILPNRSIEFLNDREISEEELYELLMSYYTDVSDRMNIEGHAESIRFLKAITWLNFSELSHFSLIREEEPKISVFIELDEEAKRLRAEFLTLLEKLREVTELRKIFELRANMRKILAEMENYTVRVYGGDALALDSITRESETRYLPSDKVNIFYDGETGFKTG
jgi:CRISPR-associated endonuclease/helicase Cas3